jgi:chorismate-pyruvate lyase
MTTLYTARAEAAAREAVHVVITARTAASPEECQQLQADDMTVLRRDGELVTAGGRVVAVVTSWYAPGRMPMPAARLLARTAVPLGQALEAFGGWRDELEPQAGRTRGLLWLPGGTLPAAMARELAL